MARWDLTPQEIKEMDDRRGYVIEDEGWTPLIRSSSPERLLTLMSYAGDLITDLDGARRISIDGDDGGI